MVHGVAVHVYCEPHMGTAVRRPPSEAVRAAIIEATIRLIGHDGVDGVTHRAVAHEARVSLSSTTYHFASRDEIVSEALRRVADLEIERISRDAGTLAEGHGDVASIARALTAWLAEQVKGDDLRARARRLPPAARGGAPPRAARHPPRLGRAPSGSWPSASCAAPARRARDTDAIILSSAIDGLRLDEVTAPRPGFERRARR